MHSHDPATLVRSAREVLSCPKCGGKFGKDHIEMLDVIGQKGVFAATCTSCSTSILTVTGMHDIRHRIQSRGSQVHKVAVSRLSPADVTDITTFLDRFDGDFTKEFAEEFRAKKVALARENAIEHHATQQEG